MTNATIDRGTKVFAHDGVQLGEVGETRPDHFQVVHAEGLPGRGNQLWLERSTIEATDDGRILVGFVLDQLEDYRMAEPGAAHVVPATSKHDAYIAGATEDEANELADPALETATPDERSSESR